MSNPIDVECEDFGKRAQWFDTEWDEDGNPIAGEQRFVSLRRFWVVSSSGETFEGWSMVDCNFPDVTIEAAHAAFANDLRAKAAGTAP